MDDNDPDARKQLQKMNQTMPGFASQKEWVDLDHALEMSVKFGTSRFISRSQLGFGASELVYPEDPKDRDGMMCVTDMHAPIGNSIGWASVHMR
eukprot:3648602-Karenia_brevis.AAC.1